MYTPAYFEESDPQHLAALMRRYSFATLVTIDDTAPVATHLPMLYHPDAGPHGTLLTHMARANPQWREFVNGRESLVIFHGPHAYISPSWYEATPNVPTWNYAAVHAYGIPRIVDDAATLRNMLRELVSAYESHRRDPYGAQLTDAYLDALLPGIVGMEIPVTRLEGKFKLSQNRSATDQAAVIAALEDAPQQVEREVAELMTARRREACGE